MTIFEMMREDKLLRVAHRGASAVCPENTRPAFERAIEQGADLIELDVRLTKDNHLIVIHDASVDRITDGHGLVGELTLDYLQSLDAGQWFDASFTGTRLMTLDEVLDSFPSTHFNIELKSSPTKQSDHLVQRVLETIATHESLNRVLLSSFDHGALHAARVANPKIALGALYVGRLWPAFRLAKDLDLVSFHADVEHLNLQFNRDAKAQGYAVFAWTARTADEFKWCEACEVNGIIMDDLSLEGIPQLHQQSGI